MLRRLIVGLVLGLVLGALLAAGLVFGLKWTTFMGAGGGVLAYFSAVVTGVLTGLVAGKPIWASDARIEAGLKAAFGALIAAGVMFVLRRWGGPWTLDLSALGAGGPGAVGQLPAASLPLIGAVLGALFELDNTGDAERKAEGDVLPGRRVATEGARAAGKSRGADVEDPASEPELASRRAKR